MASAFAFLGGARAQHSCQLHFPFPTSLFSPFLSSSQSFHRIGHRRRNPHLKASIAGFPGRNRVYWPRRRIGRLKFEIRCSEEMEAAASEEKANRPPFDLNLAIVLAGFAFEAYTTPPKDAGCREIDAAGCQTVFLSEVFLRNIYDGKLLIKLKDGLDFPTMDPWGTSDPYVVVQLDGQIVKSNIKWATREPVWNEDLSLNINKSTARALQIAAWDANLVAPHKRMGNAEVDLSSLCDGNSHDLMVELEGLGGGGKMHLQVMYRRFDRIDEEKQWWRIPFVSDFLIQSNLSSSLKLAFGAENINVRQFVQFAFAQINLLNIDTFGELQPTDEIGEKPKSFERNPNSVVDQKDRLDEGMLSKSIILIKNDDPGSLEDSKDTKSPQSYEQFWTTLSSSINETVFQKLGISFPETFSWDEINLLNKVNMLSQRNAEEAYVQSGLATPALDDNTINNDNDGGGGCSETLPSSSRLPSLIDINKVSRGVLSQTENILGAIMLSSASFSQNDKNIPFVAQDKQKGISDTKGESVSQLSCEMGKIISEESDVEKSKSEDVKKMFSTAESAMEAWAMLASSLGQTSFIKSDFEKICFLDNDSTDTQVAIWRDSLKRRLVVAFRGTEQVRWKDLRTDLMLVPSGLNPERLGGDFMQEMQVHSGFLSAYDSVRNRIMGLVKRCIEFPEEDDCESFQRWHVYITGHSLGGALATLLALELSSSRMAKCGAISVTMYNFGSPRVGNKRFVDVYNEKVLDSWRVVNHRDIIPTVPRMIGYCHVAQPIYLAAKDFRDSMSQENLKLLVDEYEVDVIGEYTPDVIVNEVMKGEKELIEKILQTEINLFRSIRDGTALMQHMEDFYYVSLLEKVRSNYRSVGISEA